jgi:hypothetical protein
MWRKPISTFYADENNWYLNAANFGLYENIKTLDAGYFVPVTRFIFWITVRYSEVPQLAIHILSCIVAGFCVSSILLLKNIGMNYKNKFVIALCLGSFQSFDLLLWMNINYYVFIACILLLYNKMLDPIKSLRKKEILFLFVLLGSLGKPQLIVSCIVFLCTILLIAKNQKGFKLIDEKVTLCAIFFLACFLVFSRLNSQALELQLGIQNLFYAVAGLFKLPLSILFPLPIIGLTYFAKVFNNSFLDIFSNFIFIFASILIYIATINRMISRKFCIYIATISPIYMSLFVFANTGWASNYFWATACISCMSSRHIFPLYFLLILFIGKFSKFKFILLALIQILLLNSIYYLTQQFV